MASDAAFLRTWAGTTECWCDEIGDPDCPCSVCQITDYLRQVRLEERMSGPIDLLRRMLPYLYQRDKEQAQLKADIKEYLEQRGKGEE